MTSVDTVIVAYRSDEVIEACITAVQGLAGKVVVVDHGDGRSAALAIAGGALALVDATNPGFGAGQNRGVAATESPFVLLCNPDAVVEPAAVEAGVRFLADHPRVAAVQGVILSGRTGRPERSGGVELGPLHLLGRALGVRRLQRWGLARRLVALSPRFRDHVERKPAAPTEVESLAATAILVRRQAFDEVDGFDPRYFLYGEDVDLCRRLRGRGWRLVALPEVWARHQDGSSSASWIERETHWWTGTMAFASRWWTPAAWAVAIAAATLRACVLSVVDQPRSLASFRTLVVGPARQRFEQAAPAVESGPGAGVDFHTKPTPQDVDRITVVIRCHEQGRFLAHAVASVRAQSRPADEIVVVDDGSRDETSQVLELLEEGGPLIIVRHPERLGPAESFNAGVRESSGDLVLALDADDALSTQYLEFTERAVREGADLAYGSVERFGSESSFSPARPFDTKELGVENFLHVSTLFRRQIFEQCGGFRTDFDHLGLEDWEFWINAVERGAEGRAVEGCALHYRRHQQGSRNCIGHWTALRVHLRVHRLHPSVSSRRHLGRWFARSLRRNLRRSLL